MASVTLRNILYRYIPEKDNRGLTEQKGFTLSGINLDIPDGKSTVLLGPSGCGKTTLLKIIAGLIKPEAGFISFNGEPVDQTRPGERRIGMVFQDYALYPNYDSEDNITSYFLFRRKTKEMERKKKELFERTSALLDVDIRHLLRRKPPTLSGGEKQRVAVGRCITREPQLFLLDEPFSNLDRSLREKYRLSLKKLLNHFRITTIYVTHDQIEAAVLADNLVVMSEGRVEQAGPVQEMFDRPKNKFVAGFLSLSGETMPINFINGDLVDGAYAGQVIGVRPEDIDLAAAAAADIRGAVVTEVRPLVVNDRCLLCLEYKDNAIQVKTKPGRVPGRGDEVNLVFRKYFLFDHITEKFIKRVVREKAS
jgi:multiple sugar transport system ATP-binding protein